MRPREELRRVFDSVLKQFLASPIMKRIQAADFTRHHYSQVLRQIYFYSREDPQLQAFATAWFRGSDRQLVR